MILARQAMKSSLKSVPFIVLNVLISALTTLLVLYIWDRTHQVVTPGLEITPQPPQMIGSGECEPFVPPKNADTLQVISVFGTGDAQKEEVSIQRVGAGELCLNGWRLEDDDGNIYSFPAHMRLYTEGAIITLSTRTGNDSALDLFWGLTSPVWHTGEEIHILDPDGKERAVFLIP